MTKQEIEQQAQQLAEYLDEFMSKGGGHVNVTTGGEQFVVNEYRTNDCTRSDSPCRVPNIGEDEKEKS